MPERIQRSRAKGWRMPAGAVYVGRPTKWGNPYKIATRDGDFVEMTRAEAVEMFRRKRFELIAEARADLRGKDLACWCRLDEPCHADVLLEWANG